ncbi:hypothetical protein [Amycolatopsis rifamycinica]|uniref:hypothetical protein n=1 Tax=Amycolatopsis rifamycinica TaxID=287986 RepID=UPI000ACE4732|nr:hypothetical protein [Amycolatopsis rifamycinica]
MSTPEIDPVTAESMEEDADIGGEHTEPTFRDQQPAGESDDEGADRGGMPPE